jgi:hypothetical protein
MSNRTQFREVSINGGRRWVLAGAAALALGIAMPAVPAPSAGDSYVYRLVNGYNQEVVGRIQYQVDSVNANRVTVSVSPDNAATGWARTEIHTGEGNWLRGLVESHGVPEDYEFATAFPAYVFPLDPGKSWSVRVNATVPVTGARRSVRVDGLVLGTERIRVPAGEFDTVKVRRFVYPGDRESMKSETRIVEFDWYAPALGRSVRTERRSDWIDLNQCAMPGGGCDFRGNWDVIELVTAPAKR